MNPVFHALAERYPALSDAVNALEQQYRGLTDAQLRAKTDEFRARLKED